MELCGKLILVLSCLTWLQVTIADETTTAAAVKEKFLTCNPMNATETTCPKSSSCVDNGTNSSRCICQTNQTVNEHYNPQDKTSKYCMDREAATTTTTSTKAPEVSTTTTTTTTTTSTTVAAKTSPSTTTKPSSTSTSKPIVTTTIAAPTTAKAAPAPSTTLKPSTINPAALDSVTIQPAPGPEGNHLFGGIVIPILIVAAFIGSVFAIRKYDLIDRAYNRIRHRNTPTQHYNGLMENDFDDDPLLI